MAAWTTSPNFIVPKRLSAVIQASGAAGTTGRVVRAVCRAGQARAEVASGNWAAVLAREPVGIGGGGPVAETGDGLDDSVGQAQHYRRTAGTVQAIPLPTAQG